MQQIERSRATVKLEGKKKKNICSGHHFHQLTQNWVDVSLLIGHTQTSQWLMLKIGTTSWTFWFEVASLTKWRVLYFDKPYIWAPFGNCDIKEWRKSLSCSLLVHPHSQSVKSPASSRAPEVCPSPTAPRSLEISLRCQPDPDWRPKRIFFLNNALSFQVFICSSATIFTWCHMPLGMGWWPRTCPPADAHRVAPPWWASPLKLSWPGGHHFPSSAPHRGWGVHRQKPARPSAAKKCWLIHTANPYIVAVQHLINQIFILFAE